MRLEGQSMSHGGESMHPEGQSVSRGGESMFPEGKSAHRDQEDSHQKHYVIHVYGIPVGATWGAMFRE